MSNLSDMAEVERVVVQAASRRSLVELPDHPNMNHAKAMVLRTARLQSVANWVRTDIQPEIDALEGKLAGLVKDYGTGTTPLDDVFEFAQMEINDSFGRMAATTMEALASIALVCADVTRARYSLHHDVEPDEHMLTALDETPVMGLTVAEQFAKMADDCLVRFKGAIRTGLGAGEESGELVGRVTGEDEPAENVKATSATTIKTIIHAAAPGGYAFEVALRLLDATENSLTKTIEAGVQRFAGAGDGAVSAKVKSERMGWQWIAIMDPNTCPQCEALDGCRYTNDYEPVGDSIAMVDGPPPAHFGCRCHLQPVDLNGEALPEGLTLDDYLGGFSREEQEQAFGKENLRKYRRGDITPGQLTSQKTSMMTLENFKKAEGGGGFNALSHQRMKESTKRVLLKYQKLVKR